MALVDPDTLRRLVDPNNEARVPEFEPGTDLTPILLSAWQPPVEQLMQIVDQVARAGFARVLADREPARHDLLALADLLSLGPPLAAQLPGAPTDVSVTQGSSVRVRASGTPWQSDGTLHPLGDVRTSLVVCSQPAGPGNAFRLFNATGAFVELAARDPLAAAALMAPDVLVRTDTVQGRLVSTTGPAFGVLGSHLLTRYGRSDRDQWRPPVNTPQAVWRALDILDELASPRSPYYLEFTMAAGECLVLSTARICYGRPALLDGVDDSGGVRRELFATDLVIAGR